MKLDEYSFKQVPQEVVDFKDQVTLILNNGRYSAIVVGTTPTWTARNGEFVFFNSANVTRTYFYNNNQWNFLEYPAAGGSLTSVSNMAVTLSNNAASQGVKGWVSFAGSAGVTIHDSYGVGSVTRYAVGSYMVSWNPVFLNSNYTISVMVKRADYLANPSPLIWNLSSIVAGSAHFFITDLAETKRDGDPIHVMAVGDM